MRFICLVMFLLGAVTSTQAQFSDDRPERRNRTREPIVQAAMGVGWRFDHTETGKTVLPELGLYVWPTPFSAIQARVSFQPQQDVYYISRLTVWSFSFGVRVQAPHAKVCGFGSFDLDETWYHGSTVFYSADEGTAVAVGRLSLTQRLTGAALSGGVALRLNRHVAIDLGLRKVLNASPYTVHEADIPPFSGEYYLKFPRDLYNQATIFVQTRIGL